MYFLNLGYKPNFKGRCIQRCVGNSYPYLYFYKIPIRLWISCANCWVSWRTVCLSSTSQSFKNSIRIPKSCLGGGAAGRAAGRPGREAVLLRHFLSWKAPFPVSAVPIFYATPHPFLFWSREIKGRLNYSNLNEASWVEVLLTLRAKMGSTWGHRWVEALCAWLVRLGQSSVALYKTLCEKNILIMSVKQADIEIEAQITPKGVFLYIFSRCKYLFNYVN